MILKKEFQNFKYSALKWRSNEYLVKKDSITLKTKHFKGKIYRRINKYLINCKL